MKCYLICFALGLLATFVAADIDCPDHSSTCPDDSTCCELEGGSYGCCPQPNAVCCEDKIHCCPEGYTCDDDEGLCLKKMEPKFNNQTLNLKTNVDETTICPGGIYQCPDHYTCCPVTPGSWSCCPLVSAVCCQDGYHCCPVHTVCDLARGLCLSQAIEMNVLVAASSNKIRGKSITCPDGVSQCADSSTCCLLPNGKYGCCPLKNAQCCSDHIHCCPVGTFCDPGKSTCSRAFSFPQISYEKAFNLANNRLGDILCPDGSSSCPEGNTCCKTNVGDYGCCPMPEAVCCSDGEHCCPKDTKCNESACEKEGSIAIPWFTKKPAKSLV